MYICLNSHFFFIIFDWKGFAGELCDTCAVLPGCNHGSCNASFECNCHSGWTGLFCTQGRNKKSHFLLVSNFFIDDLIFAIFIQPFVKKGVILFADSVKFPASAGT